MSEWKQACVRPGAPLRDVLATIDTPPMHIALVIDADCHLRGTVTDGDIRRALLAGCDLDSAVEQAMNGNPITGLSGEDDFIWQRTMERHALRHLPLLDAAGCVVDLVRYQPPREPRRDNPVVLMAGGLGMRLRPLTEHTPKPLLPVGSKPILETIIEGFVAQGFWNFHICVNYKGDLIREQIGDGARWDVQIRYVEENQRLGTAGALSLLPQDIGELPMIVMNGDLLTKVDFVRLLHFHERQNAAATLCVREHNYQVPYGVVEMDGYQVRAITEKPVRHYYVNAGIYVLQPRLKHTLARDTYLDMPQLLSGLINTEQNVVSFPLREYWIDIGQMEQFRQADADYMEHFA